MIIERSSPDGNAWVVMAHTNQFLDAVGRADEWEAIQEEMMSGSYDNLCRIAQEQTHGSIKFTDHGEPVEFGQ